MKKFIQLACVLGLIACNGSRNATEHGSDANMDTGTVQDPAAQENDPAATAPVIVYRTKSDRSDQVPVALSSDGKILSYPHPSDVKRDVTPIELGDGYLLDRRGIGTNVAYLDFTYAEYAALLNAPSLTELEARITDRDPLIDLYDCGRRADHNDPEADIRSIIANGELEKRCKKLK